jgi:hypothetical protein
MGHSISARAANGDEIPGPYFGKYFGHLPYSYFESASPHHGGSSGDGLPLPVTQDGLRQALRKVGHELERLNQRIQMDEACIDCLEWALRNLDLKPLPNDSPPPKPPPEHDSDLDCLHGFMRGNTADDYTAHLEMAAQAAKRGPWNRARLLEALQFAKDRSRGDGWTVGLLDEFHEFLKHCIDEGAAVVIFR